MGKTGRDIYGAFEVITKTAGGMEAADAIGERNKMKRGGSGGGKKAGVLFPAIYRESLIIRREMRAFARSFQDMLHELGHTHPSIVFRDFVRGYAVASGSEDVGTAAYLSEKLREYHVAAKQRMFSYISTSEMLATVGSFGLIMFPMLIVVGGILADSYTLLYLCAFGIFLIPVLITILIKKDLDMSPVPEPAVPLARLLLAATAVTGSLTALLLLASTA